MQTIKTAVVVVLLLGVCYGAFVALNAPDPVLPPEIEGAMALDIDQGNAVSVDIPQLDHGSGDVTALSPPNLTPSVPSRLQTPPISTDSPALSLPNLEPSLAFAPESSKPPEFPELVLPSGIEGSSVPLSNQLQNTNQFPNTNRNEKPLGSLVSLPEPSTANSSNTLTLPSGERLSGERPSGGLASPGLSLPAPSLSSGSLVSSPSSSNSPTATNPTSNSPAQNNVPYSDAKAAALKLASAGKLKEALQQMSSYYHHIDLTHEEHSDMVDLLDALTAEVIYSKRHLLESPFVVKTGETLEAIANRYHVSPETLASINVLGDSKVVLAGTQLKVLNGPFRADVNLTRGELTLFLGELYAGRFPISVGREPTPTEGTFQVVDRRRDRTYYGANSQILSATDNRNPYGGYWMSLGQDLCIHGSPATSTPELANAGCISLAPLDAREVYNILAHGSQITIHR